MLGLSADFRWGRTGEVTVSHADTSLRMPERCIMQRTERGSVMTSDFWCLPQLVLVCSKQWIPLGDLKFFACQDTNGTKPDRDCPSNCQGRSSILMRSMDLASISPLCCVRYYIYIYIYSPLEDVQRIFNIKPSRKAHTAIWLLQLTYLMFPPRPSSQLEPLSRP